MSPFEGDAAAGADPGECAAVGVHLSTDQGPVAASYEAWTSISEATSTVSSASTNSTADTTVVVPHHGFRAKAGGSSFNVAAGPNSRCQHMEGPILPLVG